MKQRYIVMDVALCHDCNNCFIACKDEHADNDWAPYTKAMPWHGHRWMNILRHERGENDRIEVSFLPKPCMHCEDASCMKNFPDAISRRDDGIVMIDMEKAKGKKDIVESCPYEAIYYNEEEDVAQKCTMCAHLLDNGWDMPRCVHACPTGALNFYTIEPSEMEEKAKNEGLEVFMKDCCSKPSVYYKNLYRFDKNFVTGGILKDGDCAEGVVVELKSSGIEMQQQTDAFGEYRFDGLENGEYQISAEGKDLGTVTVFDKSIDMGDFEIL